ncbi:Uncharacterized protein Fot_32853 [Forsythia ovata]|uniref:Uncharacterized protein n=1 Tax=Forsythia ovata TaxID=205694 RepID=A0ABD1T904_9LAMI
MNLHGFGLSWGESREKGVDELKDSGSHDNFLWSMVAVVEDSGSIGGSGSDGWDLGWQNWLLKCMFGCLPGHSQVGKGRALRGSQPQRGEFDSWMEQLSDVILNYGWSSLVM